MAINMDDYTRLGALAWELFSGEEPGPDEPFFRRFVQEEGGTALDVGCGTGRLLIPFLQAGLAVDGVDASADMLEICRHRAEQRGFHPVLKQQRLESLNSGRAYRTILVPCGTLMLVTDRTAAFEALRRLRAHLEPGGVLVLTSYLEYQVVNEPIGEWKHRATRALPDGTEISKHVRVDSYSLVDQTMETTVRYRRLRNGEVIEEQLCPAPERWYYPFELMLMLETTGFRDLKLMGNYDGEPLRDDHDVMILTGRR